MNSEITTERITRIQTLAAELDQLGRTAIEKAIEAGNLLRECKESLAHGDWLPWLKSNFAFSERTAQNWISIARAEARGDLKSATVADLGINEAIKLARPEKETSSEQLIAPSKVDFAPPTSPSMVDPDKCIDVPRGFFKSVSSDKNRLAMRGIRVDANERRLVATNGRGLATMSIPGDQKIVDGFISRDQWKAANALSPSGSSIPLQYTEGRIGGVKYDTDGYEMEHFPSCKVVSGIITRPLKSRDIILDYTLLHKLCLSLVDSKRFIENRVTISIPDDENDPKVLITVGGKTGVLMLCQESKAEK